MTFKIILALKGIYEYSNTLPEEISAGVKRLKEKLVNTENDGHSRFLKATYRIIRNPGNELNRIPTQTNDSSF